MNSNVSPWQSIQTRVTLFTPAVFVLAIWALSFFVSRSLQTDMERLLGEQQFSVVTAVAKEVNDNLTDRMTALEAIAKEMDADLMASPAALQTRLQQRPLLQLLFNGGVWVAGLDGTAIADVPLSAQRLGVNYLSVDVIAGALKEGKITISAPILGKKRQLPIVSMAVPIRDSQGKVIGVMSGVTDLGKHSFLDQITQNSYGKTGGYFVIALQHRLVVAATDTSRAMQALPADGINPAIDRFINGYEGYAVLVNAVGVSVLSASKLVPAAAWAVSVSLPTAEAFAPVREMQQRLLWATLLLTLLTLLTGTLTWWILKRQLSPLLETADAMRALAQANVAQPLPVTRHDEIGQLVQGFNQLLQKHQQREATLRASEAFKDTVLNSLNAEIAVLDRRGVIVAVNDRWQRFASDNGLEPGKAAANTCAGTNYLAVFGGEAGACTGEALEACVGLIAVMEGRLPSFTLDYPCDSATQQRWFTMTVMPLGQDVVSGVVVTHTDITQRRQDQEHLALMNKRMSALIEAIPDPIFFKDGMGRWLITNESAKRLYQLHTIDSQVRQLNL